MLVYSLSDTAFGTSVIRSPATFPSGLLFSTATVYYKITNSDLKLHRLTDNYKHKQAMFRL